MSGPAFEFLVFLHWVFWVLGRQAKMEDHKPKKGMRVCMAFVRLVMIGTGQGQALRYPLALVCYSLMRYV